MTPETTIAELLKLWPRLPELAGVRWPALYWQLVGLLRVFNRAETEEQRAGLAIWVARAVVLLRCHRANLDRPLAGRQGSGNSAGGAGAGSAWAAGGSSSFRKRCNS